MMNNARIESGRESRSKVHSAFRSLLCGGLAGALLLVTPLVLAQGGAAGTILGNVTDSSGAVVAGAEVDIRNVETGVVEKAQTTQAGDFSVPYLHPGNYTVTITATGFQQSVTNQIALVVDQHARINVSLMPGKVSDVVRVSTAAVTLDTDTAEISQVINSKEVVDLPLNSRNFVSLLFLNPGTVMTGGESGGNSVSAAKGSGAISISGGRSSSNQYLIDGMYNNDTVYQTPAISPSIDAIQEFKTQSGAYSAEFGGSANQVNISFRSGTNQFHGTAFEFLRNDDLDARTFNSANPTLRQNQFGYTLGGPVLIPKLYNGRDKSFFFANYEGIRIRQSATVQANVPTQAELGIGTPNGEALIPATGSFALGGVGCASATACTLANPNNNYAPYAQDGSGNFVVPSSDFSNFGTQVRTHIPVPNATGAFNYINSLPTPTAGNQQNYRYDQNLGLKDAGFFRYSVSEFIVTTSGVGLLPEGQDNDVSKQSSYIAGYTHTFTPNLINQFHFGYLESINNTRGVAASAASLAAVDIKGLYSLTDTPYPEVGFTDGLSTFGGAANNDPEILDQPTYDLADSIVISRGRHTISTGFDLRWLRLNDGGNANEGLYTFNGTFSGSQAADLLLGDLYEAQGATPTPFSDLKQPGDNVNVHHWFLAPYVEDDWKVTPQLTVNAGLRYDFNSVPYNQNNHYGWFDQSGPGYLVVADKTLFTDGLDAGIYKYAGGRTPFSAQKKVFAPRLGIAYRPIEKTVFRGGYGIFFDSTEDSETRQFGEFYPYSVRQNLTAAKGSSLPLLQADQVFTPITTLGPVNASDLTFLLTNADYKKNPYVQEYDISIERELTAGTTAEVSYVGNRGTHLIGRENVNQAFPYDPSNPTSLASRTPFSNFGEAILVDEWNINSNYNALNVKVQANTHGLNLIAAYTWSKSMDEKSAASGVDGDSAGWAGVQNPHDIRADYARSGYDVGQRFVSGFVYDLPIGKGRAVNLHGVANTLVGGWQVNGIVTFQGGFPFSVNATDSSQLNGDVYAERANLVGPIRPSGFHKNASHWFNNTTPGLCLGTNLTGAAFCNPSVPNPSFDPTQPVSLTNFQYYQGGEFGDSGRNIIRSPGLNNLDSSVFKNFAFTERLNAQFRVESFNTFNHLMLGQPDAGVNDSNFGTITSARIPGRIVQIGAKVIF